MGNLICASRVAHLSPAASDDVSDLVLFRLIGGDAYISSFGLLLFLHGARIYRFAPDVEGIFFVLAFSYSSSIRVPPHLGEDSMVNTSMFSSVIMALTSSASVVAAYNAAPVLAFVVRASILVNLSTGFSCAFSSNCAAWCCLGINTLITECLGLPTYF